MLDARRGRDQTPPVSGCDYLDAVAFATPGICDFGRWRRGTNEERMLVKHNASSIDFG
jgi:hypothetical protein